MSKCGCSKKTEKIAKKVQSRSTVKSIRAENTKLQVKKPPKT